MRRALLALSLAGMLGGFSTLLPGAENSASAAVVQSGVVQPVYYRRGWGGRRYYGYRPYYGYRSYGYRPYYGYRGYGYGYRPYYGGYRGYGWGYPGYYGSGIGVGVGVY